MTQLNQDAFAENICRNVEHGNGYFIDIGAAHPIIINNTYMLEKKRGWNGLSFDIGDKHTHKCEDLGGDIDAYKERWESCRDTKIIIGDATKLDYRKIFKENNVPKVIEYLSMDLEPKEVTLEALKLIPFDEYQFKVITYETDEKRGDNCVAPSREIFEKYGYTLYASVRGQDDFWVKKDLIDCEIYERIKQGFLRKYGQGNSILHDK